MSFVDIVDENDLVIGQAPLNKKEEECFISRNVIVFIQDDNGEYIICKRAAHKKVDPNLYDASVCGNVHAGESYEAAALRELEEELGITCELEFLNKFCNEFPHKGKVRKHYTAIFYGKSNSPVTLNEELSKYVKVSFEELYRQIHEQPENFCYGFHQEFLQVEHQLRER